MDMKLGPITEFAKRTKTPSKKVDVDVMLENSDVIVIFGFLANIEQPGLCILDTESAKVIF